MTIPRALALVILPTKEHLLNRDVAGRPAGRFLLDRLAACQNVDLLVVSTAGQRPEWCASVPGGAEEWPVDGDIDDLSSRSVLMCDARAWLSPAALSQLFLKIDQGSDPFAVRTRINHHSFIGDAELAEQVTIGAGTITCNHDGAATQKTIIDRGAYIGSGCNLVAPVRIGERATVGAGSTITRDVPAERLTVARTRQTTIEHWRGRSQK